MSDPRARRVRGAVRAAVAVAAAAASLVVATGGANAAAGRTAARAVVPSRPMVVFFAPGLNGDPNQAPAGADPVRNRMAVRALRDLLIESNVVDPVLYSPEAPLFVRALQESKLTLKQPIDPEGVEQVAVGKAVGARFTAFVFVHPPDAGKPGMDVEILMVDVETGKSWGERCRAEVNANREALPPPSQRGEANAAGNGNVQQSADSGVPPPNDAVMSAANTLVAKMMAGPLKEYAREVTPPSLLPPKQDPVPATPETAAPPPPQVKPAGPPPASGGAKPPPAPAVPPAVKPETGPERKPGGEGVAAPPRATPPPVTAAAPPPEAEADPAVPAGADPQAEAERRQGEQFLKEGNTSGAILSLRRAVNLAPQSVAMRASLVRAYIAAKRNADAATEARRALTLTPPEDRAGRLEMTRLLAEAMTQGGDTTAARAMYEQVIAAQPGSGAQWARVGLANLLEKQGKVDDAEALYRAARQMEPDEKEAALGLARVLAAKGDYEGAIREMAAADGGEDGPSGGQTKRYETAIRLFDDGAGRIVDLLTDNRNASERGTLSRDVFYKATAAQSARVNALLALLKAVPPPTDATEVVRKTHRQRVFAASLLTQGVAALMTQLETGDATAGSQATVFMNEFRTEMTAIRRAEGRAAAEADSEETSP